MPERIGVRLRVSAQPTASRARLREIDMPRTGIYRIRNLRNQKCYVGQAAQSFEKRWNHHRHSLLHGKHRSPYLQKAWNKSGEQAFAFEVIEEIPRGQKSDEEFGQVLVVREQYWLDRLQPFPPHGYNIARYAGSQLGYQHSEESKRKMSKAGRGRELTDEWKQSISDSLLAKGITRSQAERDNLSAKRARLRKDEVFEVLDMYVDGVSMEEIAQRFGVSTAGISKIIRGKSYRKFGEEWCRARGVKTLPNRQRASTKLTRDDVFDILDRDKAGEQRQTIAAIYDIPVSNVTLICQGHPKYYRNWYEEWCKLRGVSPDQGSKRKVTKLTDQDVRGIIADLNAGVMKKRDIARKYGVSLPTIYDIEAGRTHQAIGW